MIPNILSIAGSDPSGGAGIQADIKSMSANGGYAMAAITALTAQNTRGVQAVQLLTPDIITAQITAIRDDIRIDAVKIGMLGNAAIIGAVADALADVNAPIVLDPVMVAKGGDRLLAAEAVDALRRLLLPMAALITPNLPEIADLLGCKEARDTGEMAEHAERLMDLGARAVLLKGGHLDGPDSPDLLMWSGGTEWLHSARIDSPNTHGTGCTLSSAIAAHLGAGLTLLDAVQRGKLYVTGAIADAHRLSVGHGHGPTHHFHLWQR
ncbi:bifunctional hydroxymethylpyrimidine kinase/phosphomethylpyrimidine kinase [Roseovarius sp. Pro17]|uniref:bifunctional hydroxymethylpyrimidine kinase/phosphomethylpyrimidine kinase n=1 Tax=Roseovarius sp. Pro17 TaxID=3108175 RepID=UPI002D78278C|nr:bifunctional hydroxymethylpyrimidine kinase/phosphomethylpyrimidine kinase [Roseovarius sp. Pro17]